MNSIIHIHGGERTGGLIMKVLDINSKLSHLHFVSTNEYKKRVIQLERKNRVHNVVHWALRQ